MSSDPADSQLERNITSLEALGLDRDTALAALKTANGDVGRAADLAFEMQQQSDRDEVSPSLAPALPAFNSGSSSAPASPPLHSPTHAPYGNVRWDSSVVRKSAGDDVSSGDDSEDDGNVRDVEDNGEDDWVDMGSPPLQSMSRLSETSHRRLPSASSAYSRTSTSASLPTTSSTSPGPTATSTIPSSRASSIYSTSSKKSKRNWTDKLTSPSSSSVNSMKRSSIKMGSSPPSSRPLSHSVIRSLPLGSMVPLGDQKKPSTGSKARKLNAEAAKYDETAQNLVANLFAKTDSSTSSLPLSTSSATKESKDKEESSYYRPRLNLFGRRSHNSSPTASPQPASATLPTAVTPPAVPVSNPISSKSALAPVPPTVSTIPPTPIIENGSTTPGPPPPSISFEEDDGRRGRAASRLSTRSMSPFFSRGRSRSRARSPSSDVGPLRGRQGTSEAADSDSDDDEGNATSGDEGMVGYDGYDEDDYEEPDDAGFDEVTDLNTDANAESTMVPSPSGEGDLIPWSDLYQNVPQDLGEGPNVVIPPQENYLFTKTSTVPSSGLKFLTGRPEFGRDRCTVKLAQGDPDEALERRGKRQRRYVVASDLSEESGYAVEWAIGTVARDGDEIWVVNVQENESKVDPKDLRSQDKQEKIKLQRERQGLAQSLARQVTGVLQRTHLNLTIMCQAIHTKNSRHMLIDLIDFLEPTLVIVGSRGLGKLKGTILGSMSHYLVQKSSVPVMVARRRLRRHLKRTDPSVLRHTARVSLAEAGIEKTASGKENEVFDAADLERDEDVNDKDAEHVKEVEQITGEHPH